MLRELGLPSQKCEMKYLFYYQSLDLLVDVAVKAIAIEAGGPEFKSLACQVELIVANSSPPLRRFFGAVLARR